MRIEFVSEDAVHRLPAAGGGPGMGERDVDVVFDIDAPRLKAIVGELLTRSSRAKSVLARFALNASPARNRCGPESGGRLRIFPLPLQRYGTLVPIL